jgi:hypothetical protein
VVGQHRQQRVADRQDLLLAGSLRQERGLIRLDDEEVVAVGLPNLLTERALAVERIPGHQPAPQGQSP